MGTGLVNLLFEAVDLVQVMVGTDNQKNFSSDVKSLEKKLKGWYGVLAEEPPSGNGVNGENEQKDQETGQEISAKDALITAELMNLKKKCSRMQFPGGESYHINVWLRRFIIKIRSLLYVHKVIEKHGEIIKVPSAGYGGREI